MKPKSPKKSRSSTTFCFGSRISRDRLMHPEILVTPGPGHYYHSVDLIKKSPNKAGYTLFASSTPRGKDISELICFGPPVGTYDAEKKKKVKQSPKPFGIGAQLTPPAAILTPGPGTYMPFKRTEKFCMAFGHDKKPFPLAQTICNQFNLALCHICKQTPIGDYWRSKDLKQDMCRPCMKQELGKLHSCKAKVTTESKRRDKELKKFVLMRYCAFYHEHHCTKAAVQIMIRKELIFKVRKENYFASYGL